MAALHEQIVSLMRDVADLKRRIDSTVRHGTVVKVDAKKHLVKLKIGGTDDEPQESPWVPYAQIAGALKVHTPPSEGQQMTLFSPTGDFRQGLSLPLTWSEKNKSPSDKPDEHVLTFENVTITVKKDSLKVTVGDASIEVTKDSIRNIAKEVISSKVGNSDVEQKSDTITSTVSGSEIEQTGSDINLSAGAVRTVGATYLGVDGKGESPDLQVLLIGDIPAKQTFSKQ
jgi:phage baseplate assembly protein V